MFIVGTIFNNRIKMINFTVINLKIDHPLKEREIHDHRKGIYSLVRHESDI